MINNEHFWNGLGCVEALDYGQICTNESSNNECQYLTQKTSCIGPAPFRCQCSYGKYFNYYNYKCENLLEIDVICLQTDSCKNGNCLGSPSKCRCSNLQYFNIISGKCQNQLNFTLSNNISSSSTSIFILLD